MNDLFAFFLLSMAINLGMFVPAFAFKTDKFTDISYSLSFIALSAVAYFQSTKNWVHTIALAMVAAWAVRLGGFLLYRIWKIKRDKRFDGMRESFRRFLGFWVLQGISVFVVLLSALSLWLKPDLQLNAYSLGGIYVFVVGLFIEATADWQKFGFNNKPKNKGKWIDSGLWKLSRHPNYFGEILVWVGMWLYVVPYMEGWELFIVLVSPLFIMTLLILVSGIPLLEKSADKKWGKDKAYQEYKKKTPVLVPFIK